MPCGVAFISISKSDRSDFKHSTFFRNSIFFSLFEIVYMNQSSSTDIFFHYWLSYPVVSLALHHGYTLPAESPSCPRLLCWRLSFAIPRSKLESLEHTHWISLIIIYHYKRLRGGAGVVKARRPIA